MGSKWFRIIKEDAEDLPVQSYDMVDLETERLAADREGTGTDHSHDCSQLQQEAFEAGMQAGILKGKQEVQHQAEAEIQQALSLIDQVEAIRHQMVAQSESDIVELALAMANRVIHRETCLDSDIITNQVRSILGGMEEKGLIHIRVHPDDVGHLERVRTSLTGSDGKPVRLRIEGDPSIQSGGCIVDSNQYFVDATISKQLEEIWCGLMGSDAKPKPDSASSPDSSC